MLGGNGTKEQGKAGHTNIFIHPENSYTWREIFILTYLDF